MTVTDILTPEPFAPEIACPTEQNAWVRDTDPFNQKCHSRKPIWQISHIGAVPAPMSVRYDEVLLLILALQPICPDVLTQPLFSSSNSMTLLLSEPTTRKKRI